jgi:E3 ubiquitin-protein ligase MYCBP2
MSYFCIRLFYQLLFSQAYENYSFEELRFTSPAVKRSSENMLVRPNSDGTYSATWTPGSVGWYSVLVTIDGYDMEEVSVNRLLVLVA